MQPNGWGLYDMIGNAWEWCQDGYDSGYYEHSPLGDPEGPIKCEQRVIRGGSVYDTEYCRSASRQAHPPESRWDYLEFRVGVFVK